MLNPLRRDPNFIGHSLSHKRFSPLSSLLIFSTSAACKLLFKLSSVKVLHTDIMTQNIVNRPRDKPIITVANHTSVIDDPVIWATIPLRHLTDNRTLRWSLAAHDVCFVTPAHRWLFSRLQAIPVIRGNGIYQPSVNHALDVLNDNGWVHVFPEGRINYEIKQMLRFKWGIARMILESSKPPTIIPMFHCGIPSLVKFPLNFEGLDEVKPKGFGLPKLFKHITIGYGAPIDSSALIRHYTKLYGQDTPALLCGITRYIQDQTIELQKQVEQAHEEHLKTKPRWWFWKS